jgi:hypothetical protein
MANEEWGKPDGHSEPVILSDDFHEKSKEKFGKLEHTDVSFEHFLEHEKSEFHRQKALENDPELRYKPKCGEMKPCGNGDFEKTLDVTQWHGAHGSLPLTNFSSLTAGIMGGAITASTSHQTWVSAGTDPNVGIPTTAPEPSCVVRSSGAVRIGNAVAGFGCELLSKTFVVTPAVSTINFWYAVVLQNPARHPPSAQPFFQVRVTDAAGNVVPGAFDFGGGSDKLVADSGNPFFQTTMVGSEKVVYKDWSCAQINLSSQLDTMHPKQVTVEFITADCGYGAHWGYAYIDNFCGDCCCSWNITYNCNCEKSTHCGPGHVCFDYELPAINNITGSVSITLTLYQNGLPVAILHSGSLTSGSFYCFDITPVLLAGLDASLGGFDFVATGSFAIGSTPLGQMVVGTVPYGINAGQNNDYQIACKTCMDIRQEQDAYLNQQCVHKHHWLKAVSCECPEEDCADKPKDCSDDDGDHCCDCECVAVQLPDLMPCISVKWGDSNCDHLETNDVEVLCITVCNCYSNVTFNNLSIGHIVVTDMAGNPVPLLPDGTPSVQIFPSGPICFGSLVPCKPPQQPHCVSRELVLYTRGAIGKKYRLSFEGICFTIVHHFEEEKCFVLCLCQD